MFIWRHCYVFPRVINEIVHIHCRTDFSRFSSVWRKCFGFFGFIYQINRCMKGYV